MAIQKILWKSEYVDRHFETQEEAEAYDAEFILQTKVNNFCKKYHLGSETTAQFILKNKDELRIFLNEEYEDRRKK